MRDQHPETRCSFCAPVMAAVAMLLLAGCAGSPSAYEADKVTICHKGNETLVIPANALTAHLGHGDTRGPCE